MRVVSKILSCMTKAIPASPTPLVLRMFVYVRPRRRGHPRQGCTCQASSQDGIRTHTPEGTSF